MSKRTLDIVGALGALMIFAIPMILIAMAIKLTSKGPIIYWSSRIGRYSIPFSMPKFRSMSVETPEVATNLLENPGKFLTPLGSFLRKWSLDELPQIWSVLNGDISLVGPRPALHNEHDWITLRQLKGIDQISPGITGWAQINGRDNLSVLEKIQFEQEYLSQQSFLFDLYIIWRTIILVLRRDGISH